MRHRIIKRAIIVVIIIIASVVFFAIEPRMLYKPQTWTRLSSSRQAEANYQLGLYYYGNGRVSSSALQSAWDHFMQAATMGHWAAKYNCAVIILSHKMPVDEMHLGELAWDDDSSRALAKSWITDAAEHGVSKACSQLGAMLMTGKDGSDVDYTEAYVLLKKASLMNEAAAMYNLAVMYATALGVPEDNIKACAWLDIAADLPNSIGAQISDLRSTVTAKIPVDSLYFVDSTKEDFQLQIKQEVAKSQQYLYVDNREGGVEQRAGHLAP